MSWTTATIVLVMFLVLTSLVFRRFFTPFLAAGAQRQIEQTKTTKTKAETPLRTLTVCQLNKLIDLSFRYVELNLADPLGWGVYEILYTEILSTKDHPLRDCQMLIDALIPWTWDFAVWWRRQQTTDDFDLFFIEALGTQIKRLGYQLAE